MVSTKLHLLSWIHNPSSSARLIKYFGTLSSPTRALLSAARLSLHSTLFSPRERLPLQASVRPGLASDDIGCTALPHFPPGHKCSLYTSLAQFPRIAGLAPGTGAAVHKDTTPPRSRASYSTHSCTPCTTREIELLPGFFVIFITREIYECRSLALRKVNWYCCYCC